MESKNIKVRLEEMEKLSTIYREIANWLELVSNEVCIQQGVINLFDTLNKMRHSSCIAGPWNGAGESGQDPNLAICFCRKPEVRHQILIFFFIFFR